MLKTERGITLIALIITIAVAIILVSIAVRGIAGNDGLISKASTAVENEQVAEYEQKIALKLETTIKEQDILGKETNIAQLATYINEEEWVESVTTSEQDMIIKTKEGYMYEVYYSDATGNRYIEYLGIDDGKTIPSIALSYNKNTKLITVTSSEAQNIELMYKNEVVQTQNGTSMTYTVENTGWYKAKAETSNGKIRYAWLRVGKKDSELKVGLEVTSNGEKESGWYGKDNIPVQVTITGTGSKIYYKQGTEANYTEVTGTNAVLTINTVGKTDIYAYTVDTNGNESEIKKLSIKYDNIKPEIGEIVVTGEKNGDTYTSDVVISLSNMTDANSGIDGYYWWLEGGQENEVKYVKGTNKTITIITEGAKNISFKAKDKAGNLSETSKKTITKSGNGTLVTGITLNKNTSTINVGATDTLIATVSPENASVKAVSWSSSNETVATVDSAGVVTGISILSRLVCTFFKINLSI